MRILYVLNEDISKESGITKKIESQTKYWKLYGHHVDIVSLKSMSKNSVIDGAIILSEYITEKNLTKKFLRRFTIAKKLDTYLDSIKPDLIYTRYMVGVPDIVNIYIKHAPYIVELNTNDVCEFNNSTKIDAYLNKFTRNYFLKNASGFVSVSNELMSDKIYTKFNKKFIVIGNGYDFSRVVNQKISFNKNLKFLFIGSPGQSWHGIDKILKLANIFADYEFHLVGPTNNELVEIGTVSNNIIAHGYCDNNYLNDLIPKCDIGIATLALHRKGMDEASPLKSREYLAYGLAILVGYKDTDLSDDLEFVLNIGNYEKNVVENIEQIEKFTKNIHKLNSKHIINECSNFLDYKIKEKSRVDFLQNIFKEEHS